MIGKARPLSDRGHGVCVFSREEDGFRPDGAIRIIMDDMRDDIHIHLVNNLRNKDRYRVDIIDEKFNEFLSTFEPDIVHIGLLSHFYIKTSEVMSETPSLNSELSELRYGHKSSHKYQKSRISWH